MTVPVRVTDVRRAFGSVSALLGLTFEVRPGEMFGVIGPDGAGKTTLLRAICGLESVDAGSVAVFGADPRRARETVTASVGYLSQQFSLYGDLTIDENIEFFARLHRVREYRARRERLLALTGLLPFRTRLAERLSGGMKQKLALCCTLVHEPPLVVLDEPTTGVDPVSRREFWKLLAEFVAVGLTIVIATPYLDEAERCARVALLSEGRLLALDSPDRLRAGLSGATFEIVAPDPRRTRGVLTRAFGSRAAQLFGDRLHLRLAGGADVHDVSAVLAQAGITASIREVVPTLEDVFIDLIAKTASASGDAVRGTA